jgi:hypothetical protein
MVIYGLNDCSLGARLRMNVPAVGDSEGRTNWTDSCRLRVQPTGTHELSAADACVYSRTDRLLGVARVDISFLGLL